VPWTVARLAPPEEAWQPEQVLRLLREPRSGRPAPFTRLIALVAALGLLAVSAPVLVPVVRWLFGLL
jgi:hypothetical protein